MDASKSPKKGHDIVKNIDDIKDKVIPLKASLRPRAAKRTAPKVKDSMSSGKDGMSDDGECSYESMDIKTKKR